MKTHTQVIHADIVTPPSMLELALQEAAARRFEREHGFFALQFAVYDERLAKYVTALEA